MKLIKKPEDHTLYWVYAWDGSETGYNFDTTTRVAEARKIAGDMVERERWHHAYILWGNEDGAFTDLDYVAYVEAKQ